MTIPQLKFFCEVCRCGSIAEAARCLFITPSGLSMAINRMEKELNCKLLIRSARGVHPTPEGEFLRSHAEEILMHTDAYETFFHANTNHGDEVSLALATNIPDEIIGDMVLEFNRISGKRRVVLKEYPSPLCDTAVENGEAEIGFNTLPFDSEKFEYAPLIAYPLCLLVNKSHVYAAMDHIPTSYLDRMNLIIRESKLPYQSEFFVRCRELGVHPYVVHKAVNILIIFNMVQRDSQCFGLVPKPAAEIVALPNVVAIPFEDPNFVRTVFMFKNRNARLSGIAREWEAFALENSRPARDSKPAPAVLP